MVMKTRSYKLVQEWCSERNFLYHEIFLNENGKQDRGGLPTDIWYDDNGEPYSWVYCIDGELHRTDGPAKIRKHPDTKVVLTEEWHQNGQLHREGGQPAIIERSPRTGEIKLRKYFEHGKRTRAAIRGVEANKLVLD